MCQILEHNKYPVSLNFLPILFNTKMEEIFLPYKGANFNFFFDMGTMNEISKGRSGELHISSGIFKRKQIALFKQN